MVSLSLYPQLKPILMSNLKVIELLLQLKNTKAHGKNYNYQIYFDWLLCFQEISMTESLSQNSALNSMIKPLWIAEHDYKMLIYEKWHHFNAPHYTKL